MLQKILIYVNLIAILIGVGVIFYSHNIITPTPTNQDAEELSLKNSVISQSQIKPVPVKKFVVNLLSPGTRLRYLDIEMNILPFHEDQKVLISQNEHLLKDVVIEIASHLGPTELDTVTGKILLENRIKKQANARFGSPVIKQIYFSNFIVQ